MIAIKKLAHGYAKRIKKTGDYVKQDLSNYKANTLWNLHFSLILYVVTALSENLSMNFLLHYPTDEILLANLIRIQPWYFYKNTQLKLQNYEECSRVSNPSASCGGARDPFLKDKNFDPAESVCATFPTVWNTTFWFTIHAWPTCGISLYKFL